MKKYFKDIWYMYVITFVFCFMLFLYEPLIMFLNNDADFWFSIGTMFKKTGLLFLIVFIALLVVFNIIYFLNKDKSKKIFKICTIILFIIFICSYIQGNYLVGNLPVLDGTVIDWSKYKLDWIISIILWIVVIVGVIFAIRKLTLEKTVKYAGFVGVGIFVMLTLSLTTTYLSSSGSKKDFVPIVTYKNITKYSEDKNFIILLLDCTDSKAFYKRLNADDDFKDVFNDFTYYPDTMSGHPFTTESIPLVLTGKYFKNDGDITTWSTEAYKESGLFNSVISSEYELDVYENKLLYYDSSATRISNVSDNKEAEGMISNKRFIRQELKYILFRYLPSFLKKYSKIDEMHFGVQYLSDAKSNLDEKYFDGTNEEMINIIRNNNIEKVEDKIFKYIHLEGSHAPYTFDKNYKTKKNATYEDEIDGCLTLVKEYLNKLKENGVYDNSAIIIMADHGFRTEENGNQRMNPIFFVKGMDEKNKSMKISNKPIHFTDLNDLYKDLLEGKKNNELFKDIPNTRVRTYMEYNNGKDYDGPMIEYETKGKAWEKDKLYKVKEYPKKG